MIGSRVVAVAYSGGRDSTALLHCTARMAREVGLEVLALHVHHGLLPEADGWWRRAHDTCTRWARAGWPVRIAAARVDAKPPRGASIEAWAREVRYSALADLAKTHGANLVLLAQHRRDQAETVLLQALRGAGMPGLAAMPLAFEAQGIRWSRPWLDRSPDEIDAYVRRHRLSYVDDPSNAWDRLARGRLRRRVWPVLAQSFPDAEVALADTARWAQDAASNLAALAAGDLAVLSKDGDALDLQGFLGLGEARRRNVLRHWLRAKSGRWPAASGVQRVAVECERARPGSVWVAGEGEIRRRRDRLEWKAAPEVAGSASPSADGSRPSSDDGAVHTIEITGPGRYRCHPWPGVLRVEVASTSGIAPGTYRFECRRRTGGEQFQAGPGRPPRSLKKQYQAGGIWALERQGPLLWSDGRLVFVPGLGVDARVRAPEGLLQWAFRWEPGEAP